MKLKYSDLRSSNRGLTLIELVVVLAILVALAGLIIGNFPSLIRRASGSTSANTIQDIARAVSIRQTTLGSVGSGYDSLLVGGAIITNLPPDAFAQVTTGNLGNGSATSDAGALASLGLRQLCNLVYTNDATWSVADVANLVTVTNATAVRAQPLLVAQLIADTTAYNGTPTVWIFGVGKVSSLIGAGSTLLEAPTRTGTSEFENPLNYYQRYCVAFVVDNATASGTARRARFLGVVAPTVLGFSQTEAAVAMFNSN